MPMFNPFTSVTGKHSYTLFEIRLEDDFLVFRGNEYESSGQLLKGTVVLCLSAPLKIEDVHLRLTGTLHFSWNDCKVTATGISNQKVDRTSTLLSHRWQPFAGIGSASNSPGAAPHTKGAVLPAGNYEWPFEYMLPGDTTESVEGLPEAHIYYRLKATVARGKLAYDLHAYKQLRIIRTLESSALEFLHAMSVENIWPNKVEYSIIIPQKAVVFGSSIPLETRFTPLLKGLELGDITAKLAEVQDIITPPVAGGTHHSVKEHKKEREVITWTLPISREQHWVGMIGDTGQEGWVMKTSLDLPKKLGKCIQDVNVHGIKVRHKLKMIVALKNPDGHVSELRATLPVMIFISPHMPLDDEGCLVRQPPTGSTVDPLQNGIAPPGYGQHVLDQLYEDVDQFHSGVQTPAIPSGLNSGMTSPFSAHSRSGSAENLAVLVNHTMVTPAALSSRLQSMSLNPSHRNRSWHSFTGHGSGRASPAHTASIDHSVHAASIDHSATMSSVPHSAPPSRRDSHDRRDSGSSTPEHLELSVLSKVPSYRTAVKTPVRPLQLGTGFALPDYEQATSAPGSPTTEAPAVDPITTHMATIDEVAQQEPYGLGHRPTMGRRRQTAVGFSPPSPTQSQQSGDADERRRSQLSQARDRMA